MMTINVITKIKIRIENEFVTMLTTETFDHSANEEINIVNQQIKTFRFISSKIEFVTKSINVTKINEKVIAKANTNVIEDADTNVIEDAEIIEDAKMIENAEIIEEFESKSNRWDFDCVSTFSDSRRNRREFKDVLFLLIFLRRSRDLTTSFLLREEADDFVSRLSRELIILI